MTNTKQCPLCGGACYFIGESPWGHSYRIKCPTCHGRGTIRPTQDPRYLFWCGMKKLAQVGWNMNMFPETFRKWRDAYYYADKRASGILAGKPRRTTATWRKTK